REFRRVLFRPHSRRLAARHALILERGSAHDSFCPGRGRMVAVRRDADHRVAEPEGVADFRGGGEEGNNPHATQPSDTPRALKALFKRTRLLCPGGVTENIAIRRPRYDQTTVRSN